MKSVSSRARARRGIVLLDLLVYMSLLVIVLILAAAVFNRGLSEAGNVQRNIADIERAMKAGERWREDVRAATGPIRVEVIDEDEVMLIPQPTGEVVYRFDSPHVRRGATVALAGVKQSRMIQERRGEIIGWRWELELEQRRKQGKIRPLFTFMAVQGGAE
jgi:hypothetical protein